MRRATLERDEHVCRECGSGQNLTVHLSEKLKGHHELASVDDCLTLCRACHGRRARERHRRPDGVGSDPMERLVTSIRTSTYDSLAKRATGMGMTIAGYARHVLTSHVNGVSSLDKDGLVVSEDLL